MNTHIYFEWGKKGLSELFLSASVNDSINRECERTHNRQTSNIDLLAGSWATNHGNYQ